MRSCGLIYLDDLIGGFQNPGIKTSCVRNVGSVCHTFLCVAWEGRSKDKTIYIYIYIYIVSTIV